MRVRSFRTVAALAILCAAGCSLVNSFEDVVPRTDGVYVATDGSVIDVTQPDNFVPGDGSSDATDRAIASGGAIVVGGRVDDDAGKIKFVLAVLDPKNGHEIGTREDFVVTAVQYDGLRDLWYLFESKSGDFVPGVNDKVVLHVRQLDAKTGKWTEVSQRDVAVPQSYDSIGVTRERLSYVAYKAPEAGSGLEIVTYNTTDPASVAEMNRLALPNDITPYGAMSNRSQTGVGGFVNFLRSNTADCDAGNICQLELVPLRVPNGGSPVIDPLVPLGYTGRFGVPSYGTLVSADLDLVVFPRVGNDAAAPSTVRRFDPRNHAADPTTNDFIITDSTLRKAAVSNCANMAFVVGTNGDLKVHAIPIQDNGSGTPTNASTGHSGQTVYFEPSSKTVLAPFAQGSGFDFSAFHLEGTPTAPVLTKRIAPEWEPPADLRPVLLGIREPLPIVCN